MELHDLQQVVRAEMKSTGPSGESFQPSHVEGTPDPAAAAREIESAIDAIHPRHPYDLALQLEYVFDPDYAPDQILLVLGGPVPGPS